MVQQMQFLDCVKLILGSAAKKRGVLVVLALVQM